MSSKLSMIIIDIKLYTFILVLLTLINFKVTAIFCKLKWYYFSKQFLVCFSSDYVIVLPTASKL